MTYASAVALIAVGFLAHSHIRVSPSIHIKDDSLLLLKLACSGTTDSGTISDIEKPGGNDLSRCKNGKKIKGVMDNEQHIARLFL